MRFIAFAVTAVIAACAVPASAQGPEEARPSPGRLSFGQLQPTPQMWFYEQAQRRYADPKVGVRKKAEFVAAQRRARMATRKWFGLSNARPVATPMPWYRPYSPGWHGNSHDPHHWVGTDHHTSVVVVPVRPASPAAFGLW